MLKVIMWAFYLCVFLIIMETDAENHFEGNPVIVFNDSWQSDSNWIKYTIVKNKPLELVLKNLYPKEVICTNYGNSKKRTFVNETFQNVQPDGIIIVHKITNHMSTKWRCRVSLEKKPRGSGKEITNFIQFFDVHVKGAKNVTFTVNGKILEPRISDQPSTKFDGETIYEYCDGESIQLNCYSGPKRIKKLTYYDAQGSLIFQTDEQQVFTSPMFRTRLTARHNNYFMECERFATNPPEIYYYRLTFVMKNQARYCDTGVEDRRHGIMEMELTRPYSDCERWFNKITKEEKQNESRIEDYATRIVGLPEQNLEYQYSKNKTFYSMHYRYSSNETLQLTCVTSYPKIYKFVWNFENKSTVIFVNKYNQQKNSTLEFTLKSENDATSIQCIVIDLDGKQAYTVDVFLKLDPNSVSISLITGAIIGGVVIVVVTMSAVCVACCCCKKNKQRSLMEIPVQKIKRAVSVISENEYEVVYNHLRAHVGAYLNVEH